MRRQDKTIKFSNKIITLILNPLFDNFDRLFHLFYKLIFLKHNKFQITQPFSCFAFFIYKS